MKKRADRSFMKFNKSNCKVLHLERNNFRHLCGILMLAGCQAPTKASLLLPSASGHGTENIMKVRELWMGRDHSLSTIMGKTDSTKGC